MPETEPSLVTIRNAEIFSAGVHDSDPYSIQDLEGMATASGQVGFAVPIRLASGDDSTRLLKNVAAPSVGWVENIRTQGGKLLADLVGLPRKIGELLKRGAFKKLAVEIYQNFCQGERSWPKVLKSVVLSGPAMPPIANLRDVEALYYTHEPTGRGTVKVYQGDIMVTPPPDLLDMQQDKDTAAYRMADDPQTRCGMCSFFLGASTPGSVGACGLVEGEIAADALCDLYEVRDAYDFDSGGNGTGAENRPIVPPAGHRAQTEIAMDDGIQQRVAEAGKKLVRLAQEYQVQNRETCQSFEEAFRFVAWQHPDLYRKYTTQARPSHSALIKRAANEEMVKAIRDYQADHEVSFEEAARAVIREGPDDLVGPYLAAVDSRPEEGIQEAGVAEGLDPCILVDPDGNRLGTFSSPAEAEAFRRGLLRRGGMPHQGAASGGRRTSV